MTRGLLKIVALLLAAFLSVAAPAPASSDASRGGGPAAAAPNVAPATPAGSALTRDSNLTLGTDQQFDTSGMFWRMMLAVLLVLALGIAAFYASRKLGGRIINLPSRQIRLVETFYLGSRKTVHLIKVGDRSILVGTTPTTITAIADLGCDNQGSPSTICPK